MMLVTNLGDMPKNWQIQLRQLCEYDAELKAIQNDMRIRDDAIAQTKAKAADDRIETYGDNYSRDTWLVRKRTSLSLVIANAGQPAKCVRWCTPERVSDLR